MLILYLTTAISRRQRAIVADPPAIFLLWSERARAISTRFALPDLGNGRDPMNALRLWRPVVHGQEGAGE